MHDNGSNIQSSRLLGIYLVTVARRTFFLFSVESKKIHQACEYLDESNYAQPSSRWRLKVLNQVVVKVTASLYMLIV